MTKPSVARRPWQYAGRQRRRPKLHLLSPRHAFWRSLIDGDVPDPVEEAENAWARDAVRRALERIPLRYRRVLILRYGLLGTYALTLEEAGRILRSARERVRCAEACTLHKLRGDRQACQILGPFAPPAPLPNGSGIACECLPRAVPSASRRMQLPPRGSRSPTAPLRHC